MNSKLMKLEAPYNVIYAGGKVGRHIATLMVWNDDDDAAGGIMDCASYPVIDEGEEFPAGTLCGDAELHDCRVLCPPGGTNLYWVAKMIEYDFQQLEPVGAQYILERMKLLDCMIAMPTEKDKETGEEVNKINFDVTLYIMKVSGPVGNDNEGVFRVTSNRFDGFYFESMGTPDEIYSDLTYQLSVYRHYLLGGIGDVKFYSDDMMLADVLNRLNANQGIETHFRDM